ncbi:MAG: PD-(D/E)XK nuclease family protein [Candidatus Thermoplasmatota archaeon]|nr:PD-(D/E)XK nuclease family protein [Candidatus Thermoplasmatota archaeon]
MDNYAYNIYIESAPSGCLLPQWLRQELLFNPENELMILYPTESTRQTHVRELSTTNPSIDSSKHLTINRLVRALLTDFRQPNAFDDDSFLLYKIHQECVRRAVKGRFPLLHISGKKWSVTKTQRLALLHQEISKLAKIPEWESDPGVKEFRNVLQSIEQIGLKTHPDLMNYHLLELLENLDITELPFTLKGLSGIILLDHPPEFSEVERHILSKISQLIPIHQLCNPGQFRLGYSGAYLQDIPWCTQSSLPSWVPPHDVMPADFNSQWQSKISKTSNTQYHKVIVERSEHIVEATNNLLHNIRVNPADKILVVDANLENRAHRWHEVLRQMGIYDNTQNSKANDEPLIQEINHHLQLSSGLEAWSFDRLRRLANSALISIDFDHRHPTDSEIIPRPHVDILQNISRSFHVLGGPGAAERWMTTLSSNNHQLGDYDDSQSIKQEETQWWLANVINLWNIVTDAPYKISAITGCYSGEELPLVSTLNTPRDLLRFLINSVKWSLIMADDCHFNRCLNAVETLEMKLNSIDNESDTLNDNLSFIELVKLIIDNETLDKSRLECQNVMICTPNEAFGQSAKIIILAGLDSESWSMKPSNIPWLDNATKVKLGLANSDIKIRQARHHLRHILNSSESVIIIDTSLDEAASPSPALAEWLDDIEMDEKIFSSIPDFIDDKAYLSSRTDRLWDLIQSNDKVALKLRMFSTEYENNRPISNRAGTRGRDIRQRSSLALLSDKAIEVLPNNKSSIAMAQELPINTKLRNSQLTLNSLDVGDSRGWDERENMVSFTPLNLKPSIKSANANTRTQPNWPNLGYRVDGNTVSPSIDPRPLPIQQQLPDSLLEVMGLSKTNLKPKVWSSYRLQAWLKCPRQAWLTNHLQVTTTEAQNQDLDNRTRGLLMHDIEAEIFSKNGVPVFDKPLLRASSLNSLGLSTPESLWDIVLQHLAEKSPWLSRTNAVSVHRCRELIGVTPNVWKEYLDGETNLALSGKVANYLIATLSLENSAPLVCEWPIGTESTGFVKIDGIKDNGVAGDFLFRGRIDRVDQLLTNDTGDKQRLVIIRDMKTVNGPKIKQRGARHRQAIFDELQLALYAAAWEAAYPNDRVIGVGITEVGDSTHYYVEIDPEYLDLVENLSIGEVTTYTAETFRDLNEEIIGQSNGFRAWIDERVRTALRVIDGAGAGHVNPTVSDDCKYCKVRRLCPSVKLGGKL